MNPFVTLLDNAFGIRLLYFKLVFQLHPKSLDRGIFLHCFGVSHGQTNLQENCTVKCTTVNWRFVKANFGYRLIWSQKVKDFSNCDWLNLLPNPLPNIFCNYWTTYLIRPLPESKNCWTQRTSLAKPHIMANSRGWGLLSCQIPRDGDEKRGQIPRPPSTLQHFSLIAQSNSAILSILMCHFLFQLTSSFVIALGF